MIIGSWLGDIIKDALLNVVWAIFISGPLELINVFDNIFKYLSGEFIQELLFKNTNNFDLSNVPPAFWGFCIFSAVVLCFIFWSQYIVLLFSDTKEMKNKFVNCLKMTALAAIIIFFIPISFFILNQLIVFFTANISNIFAQPQGSSLAGVLWHIGDSGWDGKTIHTSGHFGAPLNIDDYNMIVEIFAVWFLLIALGMVSLILVQKNIELFFLFIISPIVAATMASDQGKRMNTWKDMVIAKSIASSATIVSYYTFLLVLSLTYQVISQHIDGVEKQILLIALICGGALACYNSSNIVASLVNESVGMREGMSSFMSVMAMSRGIKSGFGAVGGSLGFKKRKLDNNKINNNNSKEENEEEKFKVPHSGLRERSGVLGFLGDTLAHGTNLLYSASHMSVEDNPITNTVKEIGETFKHNTTGVWTKRHHHQQKLEKNQKGTTSLTIRNPNKRNKPNPSTKK